jgi:hypothetical protein
MNAGSKSDSVPQYGGNIREYELERMWKEEL